MKHRWYYKSPLLSSWTCFSFYSVARSWNEFSL